MRSSRYERVDCKCITVIAVSEAEHARHHLKVSIHQTDWKLVKVARNIFDIKDNVTAGGRGSHVGIKINDNYFEE